MAEVAAPQDKIEIVCKANISMAAIADIQHHFGVDARDRMVAAIFQIVVQQAALQARKHTGLSIEDVQKAIRAVDLDEVATFFGALAADAEPKPPE